MKTRNARRPVTSPDPRRAEKLQAFDRLLTIMDELREHCPWDKKQTWTTLRQLTLEEAYELSDAIIEDAAQEVKKELGDLLLHIVFYARISSEKGSFDIGDVLHTLCDKLIERHPHVYGNTTADNEQAVKENWEKIKLKSGNASVLGGVPRALPALVKAQRIQDKAESVGFGRLEAWQLWEKAEEGLAEFLQASRSKKSAQGQEASAALGKTLFALIGYARSLRIDAEEALEHMNKKFIQHFQLLEMEARKQGKTMGEITSAEKSNNAQNPKVAIIGGGNLGIAIAEGLIKSGYTMASNIVVTRRQTEHLQSLASQGAVTTSDNAAALAGSDIVIIALKPFHVESVLQSLKPHIDPKRHLVISVATGVSIKDFLALLPKQTAFFRAMPNTAIAIQESITCICHANATETRVHLVKNLFDQLGETMLIDEKLMNASTVLGACGIAYALRFIRAATQGGIEIGFDAKSANLIAAQTVKGASELLLKLNRHPEEEIDKVTTPKGCTIAGLNEMEHQGFSSSLIKGISASYKKIIE